jgi:cation transport ATPase
MVDWSKELTAEEKAQLRRQEERQKEQSRQDEAMRRMAEEQEIKANQEAQASMAEAKQRMNETARQQISIINTLMTGGYFAIISISSIKESLNIVVWYKWLIILLIISPMLCWLSSLVYAHRALGEMGSTGSMEREKSLDVSLKLTFLGFVLLVLNIIVYLGFLPSPPPPT